MRAASVRRAVIEGCSHPKIFRGPGLKFPGHPGNVAIRPRRRSIDRGRVQQGTNLSLCEKVCPAFRCRLLLENGRDGRKSECGQRFRFRDLNRCLSIQCRPIPTGPVEPVRRPSGHRAKADDHPRVVRSNKLGRCQPVAARLNVRRSLTRSPLWKQ